MIPAKIKAVLTQPIPSYLIKERGQGKNKRNYISGSTVIGLLNQAFDFDWDWIVQKEWTEQAEPKFLEDSDYRKATEDRAVMHNGKRGVFEVQPPIAHARGVLSVHYVDNAGKEHSIVKTGHGSKVIIGGASEQDSIFKAASTDALKKAATMLGIGLELYRDENEANYFKSIDYVDPWDDKAKEEFKAELDFITDFKTRFEDGEQAISQYVYAFSDGVTNDMMYITPSNIKRFVAYCNSIH